MARPGRPTVEIKLSREERETVQRWARRHSSAQALALRCRIVLACAEGGTNTEIADRVGVNRVTVSKWRRRFAADRLEGLTDAPRPGAARKIGDDVVEAIVVETLETAPKDATHWSTRGLAAKHGISRQTVSEIWRAFGLKPWRQDEFKVSPDPDLVAKIRDVVGLYLNPRAPRGADDSSGGETSAAGPVAAGVVKLGQPDPLRTCRSGHAAAQASRLHPPKCPSPRG
jgi:transposase